MLLHPRCQCQTAPQLHIPFLSLVVCSDTATRNGLLCHTLSNSFSMLDIPLFFADVFSHKICILACLTAFLCIDGLRSLTLWVFFVLYRCFSFHYFSYATRVRHLETWSYFSAVDLCFHSHGKYLCSSSALILLFEVISF